MVLSYYGLVRLDSPALGTCLVVVALCCCWSVSFIPNALLHYTIPLVHSIPAE